MRTEEQKHQLAELLKAINIEFENVSADFENGDLKVSEKQFQDLIVLVGGIARGDVSTIRRESENVHRHGEVKGSLHEMLKLVDRFEMILLFRDISRSKGDKINQA